MSNIISNINFEMKIVQTICTPIPRPIPQVKTTAIANNAQTSTLTIQGGKVVDGVDTVYTCSVSIDGNTFVEAIGLSTFSTLPI